MSLEVGQVLGGQYLIERVIGRGSVGLVYKGRDTSTGQTVAIRLILPEFDNEQVPAFFENDAKLVGQLESTNIARLFNMGFLPSGERCLIGEYVEGEVLQRRLRRVGHMSELAVAQLLIQLLESLSAAHEAGVVHRDLTPLSIFVVPRSGAPDSIKLIDFGISRLQLLTANPESPPAAIVSEIESFQYLSPEQLNGLREIDPRSNIYTLGVIAYEAITGRLPFVGKDFGDLTFNILQGDPPSVEELAPESSSPFAQLISKAMARSPNARFQYAEEMYAAISNWAIRAGISKSKLESGVSDWRSAGAEVPVSSARPSTASSPTSASAPMNERISAVENERPQPSQVLPGAPTSSAPSVPQNETLPWGATAQSSTGVSSSTADAPKPQRPVEAAPVDYFAPSTPSLGLAEEDALFAPPPTAPRDELPFVSLDALSTATAEPSRPIPEQAPTVLPRVEPNSMGDLGAPLTIATPPAVALQQPLPQQSASARPIADSSDVSNPAPVAPAGDAAPPASQDEAPDSAFRRARTILGIGGVGVRPGQSFEGNGVVVRAAQTAETSVGTPAPASSKPFRPRQATEPGINPIPSPTGTSSVAMAERSALNASVEAQSTNAAAAVSTTPAAAPPAVTTAVASAAPAVVASAMAAPAAATVAAGDAPIRAPVAQAAPSSAAMPVAASAAEFDVPNELSRKNSKKPLIVALLLVALAGVGVVIVLLQKGPDVTKHEGTSVATVTAVAPVASAPAVAAARSSSESVASAEASAPETSPAASTARKETLSAATTTRTAPLKPQKPVKTAPAPQPPSVAAPTKQGTYKGSVAKDPYNYR